MKIKIVELDTDTIAIIQEQNDWTGNYDTFFRKVKGDYGKEYVSFNRKKIDVSREIQTVRDYERKVSEAFKFCKEYGKRV